MADMTHLNVKIPATVHQAVRVTAAQQGISLRRLVEEALRDAASDNLIEMPKPTVKPVNSGDSL
ncbi:MAG: hypothetical protein R3F53_05360 [Gammaproteobacteria bacterium]